MASITKKKALSSRKQRIFLSIFFLIFAGVGAGMLYPLGIRPIMKTIDAEDWPTGAAQLNIMRRIIATNLGLGLLTSAIGASGRYWGWMPGG